MGSERGIATGTVWAENAPLAGKGPPALRFADKRLLISLNIIIFANQINRLLTMLKRFCLSALLAVLYVSAFAQENRAFVQGYSGNVEFANMVLFGKDMFGSRYQLATTHGYNFGSGAFVGGGVGIMYDTRIAGPVASAFLDAKYNFCDTKVSPFIAVRSGVRFWNLFGNFVNIGGGIDFGRFSARLSYELSGYTISRTLTKDNTLFCSFAFWF